MLKEHLLQDHDTASRRIEIVHKQVEYCEQLLGGKVGSRVLDLACGPGLHSHELARRAHSTLGIDFSPASIDWAKSTALTESLRCEFVHDDIRKVEFGNSFDLAILLYGEMNVFSIDDLRLIVRKARKALTNDGVLLLEPKVPSVIRANFESEPIWTARQSGLFSESPHILLEEGFWHDDVQMAVKRGHVVDSESGDVTTYAQTVVEYAPAKLANLVESEGFAVRDVVHDDWPTGTENNNRPAEFYPLVAVAK